MHLKTRHVLAAATMLGLVGAAGAATKTDTFQVTVNVPQNCLVTATDLNFGTYLPGGGDVPGQSDIQVACTDTLAYTVNLDAGVGGSYVPRNMTRVGGGVLEYNLYTEVAHTNVWGDGTAGTANTAGVGTGLGNFALFQVYGLIPDSGATNLNSAEGTYSDTITVSVVY